MEEVEDRAEATIQPAEGKTPRGAKEAASAAAEPASQDADAINASQIEEAKASGGEYQGKLPDRPTVKEMATEKKIPRSGKAEQA